ncbi:dTMP kinase [Thermoactinomyces mirandus]|uniref:Thymidylate kinase n=1 Tax=Thermoactinomyces mirandus TaxID=2756294 RepID=A0A7W1XVE0_9BACL|nr:dTMP kinase [Thermoactinomyces mirandus]MBA4603901.1 dTMP kinase [Thermoactinomyces mirandus]
MKGIFVTFEGPEGAGKTTQIKQVFQYLTDQGFRCLMVREPGGTEIGNRIRQILLDPELSEMEWKTEVLLYASSRAQLVREVIKPHLHQGFVVLCDRYIDSSLAYQGYGAEKSVSEVWKINEWATDGLTPDRTYLLDLPVELGQKRVLNRNAKKDRMELKEKMFHDRVRLGFREIACKENSRYCVIRADQPGEQVFADIIDDLMKWISFRK